MSFYKKISEKLKNKIPEEKLILLPRGYNLFNDVLIIKLKKELYKYKKEIGKAILQTLPYVKTVILEKEIKGIKRTPKIEIIAGKKKTKTIFSEFNCYFSIDFSKAMWSGGNKFERQRIVKQIKKDEVIVDMFAGIGYWSIFIAKLSPAKIIYAIDLNKDAIKFLKKNIKLNKISNIQVLYGDCRKFSKKLENKADRIIMGYLKDTEKFLPYALKIAKKECIIHFHRLIHEKEINEVKEKILRIIRENKCKGKILNILIVKSMAPKINHYVFDIKINKTNR
ncbi:MAG: class I SAM-dependent methyltransferase family protein [Candidatus Aenigmatarchaeota archaeon]|nr:class I SAM-dependent methyltransferase family protein [Candidatus Aenigmarchaeota archaeon]